MIREVVSLGVMLANLVFVQPRTLNVFRIHQLLKLVITEFVAKIHPVIMYMNAREIFAAVMEVAVTTKVGYVPIL